MRQDRPRRSRGQLGPHGIAIGLAVDSNDQRRSCKHFFRSKTELLSFNLYLCDLVYDWSQCATMVRTRELKQCEAQPGCRRV